MVHVATRPFSKQQNSAVFIAEWLGLVVLRKARKLPNPQKHYYSVLRFKPF
uniref:Uncharacterized protein n=1 Tax=Anguilla anguilla TaxID=7936 RepID=A0A0E9X2V4_ANGAN